jgi:hypothetical protein
VLAARSERVAAATSASAFGSLENLKSGIDVRGSASRARRSASGPSGATTFTRQPDCCAAPSSRSSATSAPEHNPEGFTATSTACEPDRRAVRLGERGMLLVSVP